MEKRKIRLNSIYECEHKSKCKCLRLKIFVIMYIIMMNINDVLIQTKTRRRGRPRKNSIQPSKVKQPDEKIKHIEEDVIIHLPIHSRDIGNDEIHTENMELSSVSESSNSDIVQTDDHTIQQLKNIIKEKDTMISNLENQIKKLTQVTECNHDVMKNINIRSINTPYEKKSNGNLIIPEHTDKSCLWDTCPINGIPCFLPDKYYDDTFFVIGSFCSINCAMAYNLQLDDSRVGERYSLLKWMYNKLNETIIPSPSYHILDKFGGCMNINEYRKTLKICDKEYRLLLPPMTYINPTLEEKISSRTKNTRTKTVLDALRLK